jgi:RNA-directed DNA polymerase
MMHGSEKSDPAIVATKPANKAERSVADPTAAGLTAAEPVEQRVGTKGNADQQSTPRTQSRTSVSQALERIRKVARERKKERFTALFHHVSTELLEEAFDELAQNAAPGVDRLTWKDYEADLERNIEDLHDDRVQRGAYRALPSRRVYIPKPDGRQRSLAVAALEDKIVQRAVVALLNVIYEEDFLGFSYGFRSGRGAHDALDALCVGIHGKKVSFILDTDIRSFFDEISQQWLIRFLEHRIGDRRIIRLIQKWLKAGILEDGVVSVDRGTGQGSVISPLLANIYLHYAFDLWAARWRRRTATGDMIIVRYADDFIVGFQHESDARRFLNEMRERLREFALSLHPEKTRLIEFGRFAAERRNRRGLGKPETPDRIFRRGIAFIPEDRRIFPTLSVEENLSLGLFSRWRSSSAERRRQFDRVIYLFPRLGERRRQLGKTLSGGEQQMLAIGRALIGNPRLLLVDEPSEGLAPMIVNEIFESLSRMGDEGIGLLLVEQNVHRAATISNACLRDGEGPDRDPWHSVRRSDG